MRPADPWSSGDERTRSEVREIFAQHADQEEFVVVPLSKACTG